MLAGLPFLNFRQSLPFLLAAWRRILRRRSAMKISDVESGKAAGNAQVDVNAKILPEVKPRRSVMKDPAAKKQLTPLEQGIVVAEQAMQDVPDVREDVVARLKEKIEKGEYQVSGEDIADMMLRRRAADRIR